MAAEGNRTPNLNAVARMAGVSTATAGRALGNYSSVRPETAERVQHAARVLGYRPNALARGLINGATRTIGVIVTDLGNPFFSGMLKGVSQAARREDYDVLLFDTGGDLDAEARAVKVLSERRVDGIIAAPAALESGANFAALTEYRVPLVLVDRPLAESGADTVLVSNVSSAEEATAHLLGHGHRRIAVVSESDESPTSALALAARDEPMRPATARLAGYARAHAATGLPIDDDLHVRVPYAAERAEGAISAFLDAHPDVTAVFTTDNVLSAAAFRSFQTTGRRCPDDVSLVGFDEHEWATLVRPTLSVVQQPREAIGSTAAERLLRRITGADQSAPVHTELAATLVPRDSSGPVSPAR